MPLSNRCRYRHLALFLALFTSSAAFAHDGQDHAVQAPVRNNLIALLSAVSATDTVTAGTMAEAGPATVLPALTQDSTPPVISNEQRQQQREERLRRFLEAYQTAETGL